MNDGTKRLNSADWFFILLAVLSVCGILFRFLGLRQGKTNDLEDFTLIVEWSDIDIRTLECLEEDEVLYTAGGEVFGIVETVEWNPSEVETVFGGDVYRLRSESRVDATVHISVSGRVSDGQFFRNATESVTVGQKLKLYSERTELLLKVVFWS